MAVNDSTLKDYIRIMLRYSYISKHIVIATAFADAIVCGIVLIEGELIYDIILFDPSTPSSSIELAYQDWNPQDLSDFYISPGVIDMNTRLEWESYTELTKASVAGGTTLALVEGGYFAKNTGSGELFCDVGKIAIITGGSFGEIHEVTDDDSILAVKGYLFPPYDSAPIIDHDFSLVFEKLAKSRKLIMIDPTLPDRRMLHNVSPYRFQAIENRLRTDIEESHSFSGAFSDLIVNGESGNDSDFSDNSDNSEEKLKNENCEKVSHGDNYENHIALIATKKNELPSTHSSPDSIHRLSDENNKRYFSIIKEEDEIKNNSNDKPVKTSMSLIDLTAISHSSDGKSPTHLFSSAKKSITEEDLDLFDKKIRKSELVIKDLSLAEISTYGSAGVTRFSHPEGPLRKNSFQLTPTSANSPGSASNSLLQRRRISGSFSVVVSSIVTPIEVKHSYYMASYAHSWEVAGIDKLMKAVESSNCRIHITSISAVMAFNRLRKARSLRSQITCEVPASHLYFSSEAVPDNDTRFKCAPPIRSKHNQKFVWDLLNMNGISTVTSNHSCIHPDYKKVDCGSFLKSLNGMNTAGFTLQAVWTRLTVQVRKRGDEDSCIVQMAKWLSLNPARILEVDGVRGTIEKGKYADLIIWNPFEEHVSQQDYSPFSPMSPFVGERLAGKIYRVILRGHIAFSQGAFESRGKFFYHRK